MPDKNISIAVAGNQWITQYLLQKIIENEIGIDLIINVSDRLKDSISGYADLAGFAEKNNIELYRPDKYNLKSEKDKKNLLSKKIDIMIVFGWQRLIPDWLIEHCSKGVYGVHGGPEKPPRCRGQAVFNWSLILGYERFYMYMFEIDPGVDSGDIIDLVEFDINPYDDVQSLYHKNCIVSSEMFIKNIPKIIEGSISPMTQVGNPTVLPKRRPENGGVNWNDSAERIQNFVRALADPYPNAFTCLDEAEVRIKNAHIFDTKIAIDGSPGEIVETFPGGHFIVMCGDQALYVRDYFCTNPSAIKKGKTFNISSGIQLNDPEI